MTNLYLSFQGHSSLNLNGAAGLPMYHFLLVSNTIACPNETVQI